MRATRDHDGILALGVDLNHRVTGRVFRVDDNPIHVHPRVRQQLFHPHTVVADAARMVDIGTRLARRNGLIQALPPREHLIAKTGYRLSRTRKVLHAVDAVDAERSEIQQAPRHLSASLDPIGTASRSRKDV